MKAKIVEHIMHMQKKQSDTIYVTELIACPLKPEYEKQFPELALASIVATPSTILGDIVHKGMREFLTNIAKEHNATISFEVEAEKQVKTFKIKGRADAILEDNGTRTVIEIKTSRTDKYIPMDHHKQQLRIYMWLFGAQNGKLVYITPDRISEYDITNPASDNEVQKLVEEYINKTRIPRYQWECTYCPYNVLCPYKVSKE